MATQRRTRFVVTNLEGDSRQLYERVYCQCGEIENRIQEQQLMLFADRTSCHKFVERVLSHGRTARHSHLMERPFYLPPTSTSTARNFQ